MYYTEEDVQAFLKKVDEYMKNYFMYYDLNNDRVHRQLKKILKNVVKMGRLLDRKVVVDDNDAIVDIVKIEKK